MATFTEVYDQPYHIIVEGADDREFFTRLLEHRGIDEYQVGCPRDKDNRCMGNGAFSKRIEAIFASSTVDVKGCIIVADCDDDPAGRFENAQKQLVKLPRPKSAFSKTIGPGPDGNEIKTAIVMIPTDMSHGGLETLLLECCKSIPTHSLCIDDFCTCTQRAGRKKLDNEKVRLRAFIAATHRDDPNLALSSWVTNTHRPFQMNLTALDALAKFFDDFKK